MNYTPETELILCCAQLPISSKTVDRIKDILKSRLNWDYLFMLAYKNNITSLFYWQINTIYPEAFPQNILNKFQHIFHTNVKRNIFLTKELLKLLNLFKEHDIPAIPFKGPVLTASVYGNLALRQFLDLDILFHKQDILKARNLLISQGYENAEKLTYEQEIAQLQSPYVKAYTYRHNGLRVTVELHWQLRATYSAFPLDHQSLWERLKPISLFDVTVFHLSPKDELLYLCVHGAGDRWQKLSQICDIAELIRTHQVFDWQEVMEQASRLGCRRRLFLGLFLAKELLGTNLPEQVWQEIQTDSLVKWLAKWVCKMLFHQVGESTKLINKVLFDLGSLERSQDRMRYCIDRSILLIAKKYRLEFSRKYGLPGGK